MVVASRPSACIANAHGSLPDAVRDDDIVVTDAVRIPRAELKVRATRASGPGGQGVNTTSSRVELLWNPATTRALADAERARVLDRLGRLRDASGNVRIVCDVTRSQTRNRTLATERLVALVRSALHVPKTRRPTKPSRAAKQARLDAKRRQSLKKAKRRQEPE